MGGERRLAELHHATFTLYFRYFWPIGGFPVDFSLVDIPSVNIEGRFKDLTKPWSPIELARINDHVVRLALFEGEYPKGFHTHDYDELFFVYRGEIIIQMRGQPDLRLSEGELGVVPKGVEHCPTAVTPSYVLMFEPKVA